MYVCMYVYRRSATKECKRGNAMDHKIHVYRRSATKQCKRKNKEITIFFFLKKRVMCETKSLIESEIDKWQIVGKCMSVEDSI